MGLQFENLVLSNRKTVQQILDIDPSEIVNDNPFFQRKARNRQGCQIDYMIQTKFGTCYLCEIKFHAQEITKSVIDEVKQKIDRLDLPKNISIRPVLIHVNGVDEFVRKAISSPLLSILMIFYIDPIYSKCFFNCQISHFILCLILSKIFDFVRWIHEKISSHPSRSHYSGWDCPCHL